jgi:2,3-bisphosphoglycerate-dependent phosphoglycerate mutase
MTAGSHTLYLIRHCTAEGQEPDAPLTADGRRQAVALADVLIGAGIDRIICSPFRRAQDSIAPLAQRFGLTVAIDDRLAERVLGSGFADWREALRATFDDFDLCYEGGESCNVAKARGVAVIQEAVDGFEGTTAVVTHGNLLTLLLKHFDPNVGYAVWDGLTNPDVFRVAVSGGTAPLERIWR